MAIHFVKIDIFNREYNILVPMADLALFTNYVDPLLVSVALDSAPKDKIHIRFQKNGNRAITLVEGIDPTLDLKSMVKKMKTKFSCAASTHLDEKSQQNYIKLQGDHRDNIRDWLIKEKIVAVSEAKERIVIHGY